MPVVPDPQDLSSMSLLELTLKRPEQMQKFLDRRVVYKDMGEWHYQLRDGSLQIFPAYDRKRRRSFSDRDSFSDPLPWRSMFSNELANDDLQAPLSGNSKSRYGYSEGKVFQYNCFLGDGTGMAVEKYLCNLYDDYSGTALRRLSLGDLDQLDLVVRRLSINFDGYDHYSQYSSNMDSSEDFRHADRSGRFQSFLKSFLKGFRKTLCFPVRSLRLTAKWRKVSHKKDLTSASSSIDESSTTSESKKWRTRVLGCLLCLFCFPCLASMVYTHEQRRRNESKNQERLEKRKVFEEGYIERHGVHSKPYLQSQEVRSLLREKRSIRAQLSNMFHLLVRIIKSAYGDALPRKPIRMPDEEKGEPPSNESLTPDEIKNLSPEELRKAERKREIQQFSQNYVAWKASLPRR